MRYTRDYAQIAAKLRTAGSRDERMRQVVDALWDSLSTQGVSWVGFYLHHGREELLLGPHRDKPACSPILLHGACGRAFLAQTPLIVRDVRALGRNYIACDRDDRSEAVLPLFDPQGRCCGVLDLDSHDTGAFERADVDGLLQVLLAAGLTEQRASYAQTLTA
jgi:putative methionine-R-sulfoxide reductase with GAF domain